MTQAAAAIKWWCYICRMSVPREHITMVLSFLRKTGRCAHVPGKEQNEESTRRDDEGVR